MTDAPIQIRRPEVVRQIRKLASARQQPITELIGGLVSEALQQEERRNSVEERRRRVRETVARFRARPPIGPMLTDDDLYDEDGFPR